MGIEYVIHSVPDNITFDCPHCGETEVEVKFSEVDFKTNYWDDGATVICPYCNEEVELDNYEYD